jgi:S-adenosylmethionine/arginine decarboxylase-like enzyme
MTEAFKPNHLHFICKGECNNAPKTAEELNSWLKVLVEKVRMKVVAGPTSVYVDDLGNEGVTGTVTLATSHASMHVWDSENPQKFQFDIYSCSEFTAKEVIEHLKEFSLVNLEYISIDRNNDILVTERKKLVF